MCNTVKSTSSVKLLKSSSCSKTGSNIDLGYWTEVKVKVRYRKTGILMAVYRTMLFQQVWDLLIFTNRMHDLHEKLKTTHQRTATPTRQNKDNY